MKITKELLKRILSMLKRFFPQWRLYGFSIALWSLLFPLHHLFKCCRPYFGRKKHRAILRYLSERYSDVSARLLNRDAAPKSFIEPDSTIWVCWWDGEEAMPALVKVCYNSIIRHAGRHPVKLITKHNFRDFVLIPEYILEKVNTKKMTVTHFSNMLRANLLYEYGGIWLDVTILVLRDIPLDNLRFYTLKAPAKSASVTLARYAGLSNTSTPPRNKTNPNISRWSGFLLAGSKHSVIFEYMRDILYAYWKDHDDQIDYVLYDYTIALGYDTIPAMRELIDSSPCSDVEKFELEKNLGVEFSDEKFAYFSQTTFHKLTWKIGFNARNKKGKLTVYGHLLEGNLP